MQRTGQTRKDFVYVPRSRTVRRVIVITSRVLEDRYRTWHLGVFQPFFFLNKNNNKKYFMIRNAILILLRIYCAFQKCHADSSSSSCLIFQKVFLLLIWSKKSVSSTLSMYKEDGGKRGRKLLFAFSKCFEKLVIFVYFSGENQQTQKNRSIDPLVYSSTLSLILYSIVMVLGKTILIFFLGFV